MVFEGREQVFSPVEVNEIEMGGCRSPRASPVRCNNGDFLKGQLLAGGRWSDVAVDIVWESKRHAGTKGSISPFHSMIFQSARQSMIPSAGPLFDPSPTMTTIFRSAANVNSDGGLSTPLYLVSVLSVGVT